MVFIVTCIRTKRRIVAGVALGFSLMGLVLFPIGGNWGGLITGVIELVLALVGFFYFKYVRDYLVVTQP